MNIFSVVLAVVTWIAVMLLLKFSGVEMYVIGGISGLVGVLEYVVLYNRMMSYVEKNVYSGRGNQ